MEQQPYKYIWFEVNNQNELIIYTPNITTKPVTGYFSTTGVLFINI